MPNANDLPDNMDPVSTSREAAVDPAEASYAGSGRRGRDACRYPPSQADGITCSSTAA